ncbi:transmembrane protein 71 isoform X2 [Engraulis encrasicolus]|uniref:transmembrane protein 71 isoform X2 n=1 Tax=Engraulis encrasicolus TaxID=184585 RepID=UPI002FD48FC8
MTFFFRGAVTSSPVKNWNSKADDSASSLDVSLLSDSAYECYSTNPLTGSVCQCRRSPRLLGNGYYVLTEDSFSFDDEGNVTLTPSKTNVSYKENLVRIFRRRRRARRSLASLLSDVSQSCQSWLGGAVFGWTDTTPQEHEQEKEESVCSGHLFAPPSAFEHAHTSSFEPAHSSSFDQPQPAASVFHHTPLGRARARTPLRMQHTHTQDREFPQAFTYDASEQECPADKTKLPLQEELGEEACLSQELFGQFALSPEHCSQPCGGGLLEVPPPTAFVHEKCSTAMDTPTGSILMKAFLLLILLLCVSTAVFSSWLMGAVVMALCFLVMISSIRRDVRWRRAKTEDITSRNE